MEDDNLNYKSYQRVHESIDLILITILPLRRSITIGSGTIKLNTEESGYFDWSNCSSKSSACFKVRGNPSKIHWWHCLNHRLPHLLLIVWISYKKEIKLYHLKPIGPVTWISWYFVKVNYRMSDYNFEVYPQMISLVNDTFSIFFWLKFLCLIPFIKFVLLVIRLKEYGNWNGSVIGMLYTFFY